MSSLNQIKYSAIISYGAIVFSILAGLFYTPWMISQIGRDDFGLYSLVTVFISYFLIDFGIGQVISTYVAKCRASGDIKLLKKVVSSCYKAYFLITTFIALILFILYFFITDIFASLTISQCAQFKVIYCIAGLFSVLSFPLMPLNGIIIAYEKLVVLKILDLAQKVLCVVLIVICLINDLGLYSLVAVNGLVGFLSGVFKLLYVRHKLDISFELKESLDRSLLRNLMTFSFWVFIMGIAQRFIIGGAPTILGAFSGAAAIAVFSIAMTLEGYVWMFSNAVNGLFIPKVAQYVEEGLTPSQLTDRMIQVGRFQLMAIGTIIGGVICLGRPFISLWVGDSFKESYLTTIFIVTPQVILVTQEIGNTLLWIKNKIKYRSIIYIVGSLISVVAGCLLASKYGAIGCGVSIFIGLSVICIALNMSFVGLFKLEMWRFYKNCHLKLVPILFIPIVVIFLIQYYYPINSWYQLFGIGILYIIMQLVLMFLSMDKYEKKIVLPNYKSSK